MPTTDGSRLKQWRQEKGISQRDLAEILGRSHSYVANIERDKTGLSRDLIARMIEQTSVNVSWLLTGTGPMEKSGKEEASLPPAPSQVVDLDRLRLAIEAIEEGLDAVGRAALPHVKAEMILSAYKLLEEEGAKATAQIIRLVKSA